ncbi:unnamed protein product [Allacma fusca]|uniref:Deoxyhypusine hydroxylase n=1 Tax=Allacma fusca TaxID=39272 RepID=A0A8J2LLJ3_9HEXA|nr:unnamed protein product [Allacma fusca]
MAASLQVDGESTCCQQMVGNCNSESPLSTNETPSQTKCLCSSNYVNKIIRVTTRQKQRIKINNFANLLNLCDHNGGIKLDQNPEIVSKQMFCRNSDQDCPGEDQPPTCPCCHCPCGQTSSQQECVYLKYCGPLVTFPFAPASNMSLRQRASDTDSKSLIGEPVGFRTTPSGSQMADNQPLEDSGKMGDGIYADEAQGIRRSSSTKITTGLSNIVSKYPYAILGAVLLSPLLLLGDYDSPSKFYPQSLFSLPPVSNESASNQDNNGIDGGKPGLSGSLQNSDKEKSLNENSAVYRNKIGGNIDRQNGGPYSVSGSGDNGELGAPGNLGRPVSDAPNSYRDQGQNQDSQGKWSNANSGDQNGRDGNIEPNSRDNKFGYNDSPRSMNSAGSESDSSEGYNSNKDDSEASSGKSSRSDSVYRNDAMTAPTKFKGGVGTNTGGDSNDPSRGNYGGVGSGSGRSDSVYPTAGIIAASKFKVGSGTDSRGDSNDPNRVNYGGVGSGNGRSDSVYPNDAIKDPSQFKGGSGIDSTGNSNDPNMGNNGGVGSESARSESGYPNDGTKAPPQFKGGSGIESRGDSNDPNRGNYGGVGSGSGRSDSVYPNDAIKDPSQLKGGYGTDSRGDSNDPNRVNYGGVGSGSGRSDSVYPNDAIKDPSQLRGGSGTDSSGDSNDPKSYVNKQLSKLEQYIIERKMQTSCGFTGLNLFENGITRQSGGKCSPEFVLPLLGGLPFEDLVTDMRTNNRLPILGEELNLPEHYCKADTTLRVTPLTHLDFPALTGSFNSDGSLEEHVRKDADLHLDIHSREKDFASKATSCEIINGTKQDRCGSEISKLEEIEEERAKMERTLVMDLLLIFHGCNGTIIRSNDNNCFAFYTDENKLHPAQKTVALRLCPIGVCYKIIKGKLFSPSRGQCFEALKHWFQEQLREFDRMVLTLEQMMKGQASEDDLNKYRKIVAFGLDGISLHQLECLFFDSKKILRAITNMLSNIKPGISGGQLCSILHEFTHHGDPEIQEFAYRTLAYVSRPIYKMIGTWIFVGTFHDNFDEFFIKVDPKCVAENMWRKKFSLKTEMIPSFISSTEANIIFRAGKNLNFLLEVCQTSNVFHDKTRLFQMYKDLDIESTLKDSDQLFLDLIKTACTVTSDRVLQEIVTNEKLFENLHTIKYYLLQGQGDFFQMFVKKARARLVQPAKSMNFQDFQETLQLALVGATHFASKEYLDRVFVTRAPYSETLKIWDVFCLEYKTSYCLQQILTADCMAIYSRIFTFLWQSLRVETVLKTIWTEKKTLSKKLLETIPEIRPIVFKNNFLIGEFNNFVTQVRYYAMSEAVETEWQNFSETLMRMTCLEDIISAHEKFLDILNIRCLQNRAANKILLLLESVYDKIFKMEKYHSEFSERVSREFLRRSNTISTWSVEMNELIKRDFMKYIEEANSTIQSLQSSSRELIQDFLLAAENYIDTQNSNINLSGFCYRQKEDRRPDVRVALIGFAGIFVGCQQSKWPSPLAVSLIGSALSDTSVLLKHELAYCLGQMGNDKALPCLNAVLANEDEDPMVRHEAGEALGAIGKPESKEILSKYAEHPCQEIAETCQLALKRIQEAESDTVVDDSIYKTNDPAFSMKSRESADASNIAELQDLLLDPKTSLYNRYKAMFTLRNIGNEPAIRALCEGLKDSTSALFRHEIAFVLGQMQSPYSTEALAECLAKLDENEMVRHECAEALGAIGTPESRQVLEKYLEDSRQVVKESVYVALDICDYEQSGSFQYADGLLR